MKFVVGRDQEVVALVESKLKVPMGQSIVTLGIVADNPGGELRGGVVLTDWNGANIEITIWTPGLMHRHLIAECYRYVFDHLGCIRLSARSRRDNVKMRKLYPRLGFAFEGTQRRFFGPNRGDDALQYALVREAAQPWMD